MVEKFSIDARLLNSEPMQRCKLKNCKAACCLYGVWIDFLEVEQIQNNAMLIKPHMKRENQEPALWFEDQFETDPHSASGKVRHCAVVEDNSHYGETACIFLRDDHLCALQVASEKNGFHPWYFKPFYCVLHPLDLTEDGKITLDNNDALLDEPASCLRRAKENIPLLETFQAELTYLLGQKQYESLVHQWKIRNNLLD